MTKKYHLLVYWAFSLLKIFFAFIYEPIPNSSIHPRSAISVYNGTGTYRIVACCDYDRCVLSADFLNFQEKINKKHKEHKGRLRHEHPSGKSDTSTIKVRALSLCNQCTTVCLLHLDRGPAECNPHLHKLAKRSCLFTSETKVATKR